MGQSCSLCLLSCCDSCKRGPNEFQQPFLTGELKQTTVMQQNDDFVIRRSASAANLSDDDFWGRPVADGTMVNLMRTACAAHSTKKAIAFRPLDKITKEASPENPEKMFQYYYLKDRVEMTYKDMWERIVGFANGLRGALNVEPGHKVAIYEDTRWEWIVSCYGIWVAGATPVTVYANLGEAALVYALRESEVDTIICNADKVHKLKALAEANSLTLRNIIYIGEPVAPADNTVAGGGAAAADPAAGARAAFDALEGVVPWSNVCANLGGEEPQSDVNTDTLALIMYTSGTTGDPKGVVLTQGNILAAVWGLNKNMTDVLTRTMDVNDKETPTYIGYLPLAHILEFAAEAVMYKNGYQVCYALNPRTLSNATTKPHGDFIEYKPVFFAGVPRVFDGLRKVIESSVNKDPAKKPYFDAAVEARKAAIKRGETTPFYDEKVFAVPRKALGGRVKWIISGGAPLSAATQEWMITVFGCYCGQGYGLTETGASCSVQAFWDCQTTNAGKLLSMVEVMLRSVEGYRVTDATPQGEIMIRGRCVAQGYYRQPEKTAEAFDQVVGEGGGRWFATGDVGQFADDGTLKIVGRTKALAKNSHGEYIAMEALESIYVQCDLVVANGIMIHVDSEQPFIVAIAITTEDQTRTFCEANGIACPAGDDWVNILRDADFMKKSVAALRAVAEANNRVRFELLVDCRFYNQEWVPELDADAERAAKQVVTLTAANKLMRRVVEKEYEADIAAMVKAHEGKH